MSPFWKWIIHFHLYITSGLLSPVIPATRVRSFYWQHPRDVQESLLGLPFAQYLANPCGIGSTSHSTSRSVRPTGESTEPLDVQSRRFVAVFAERYAHHHNVSNEARNSIARELHLVFREARHLIHQIHSMTILPDCHGVQLQSLGIPSNVVTSTGDVQVVLLYRQLVISTAHMHLMIHDIVESSRYCFHESPAQRRLLEQLTSKLEMMMCLILQLGSHFTDHFFSVTAQILSTNVYRYNECSSRQVRCCLVLNHTQHTVESLGQLFNSSATERQDQEPISANLISRMSFKLN